MTREDFGVGYRFPAVSRSLTREAIIKYHHLLEFLTKGSTASSDGGIHTSVEFAKQHGFADLVAPGMMTTNWLSQWLTEVFGDGYVKGGSLQTNYLKPVLAGDSVTMNMEVTRIASEVSGLMVDLGLRCENQKGEIVTIGTASVLVHQRPSAHFEEAHSILQ